MYEDIFNNYSDQFANKIIYSLQTVEVGINAPNITDSGRFAVVSVEVPKGTKARLTGQFAYSTSGSVAYQVVYNFKNSDQWGYIFDTDLSHWSGSVPSSTAGTAQTLLNEIIEYHKTILENNLICARAIQLSEQTGQIVPLQYKKALYALQTRLLERNETLKQNGLITNVQESTSPNFGTYADALNNFISSPGIGAIGIAPVVAAYIVIAAVVIAGSAATAIAIYKKLYPEAKKDWQYSNELTARLARELTPETLAQLQKENEKNAEQFRKAIKNAAGGGVINTIKYIGAGLLGFWAVDKLIVNRQKQN